VETVDGVKSASPCCWEWLKPADLPVRTTSPARQIPDTQRKDDGQLHGFQSRFRGGKVASEREVWERYHRVKDAYLQVFSALVEDEMMEERESSLQRGEDPVKMFA
jgi:hypothetical protein